MYDKFINTTIIERRLIMENKFGFGCMRLPMKNDEVDYDEFNQMIDLYMQEGFNYFDTAHGYLGGKSETALRDCLVSGIVIIIMEFTQKLVARHLLVLDVNNANIFVRSICQLLNI